MAEIYYRPDCSLTAAEDVDLRKLLSACFPLERRFSRQRFLNRCPEHRWLAFNSENRLVAHAAAHDLVLGASRGDLRVGGVAEVCVARDCRGTGLTRQMLAEIHVWLGAQGLSFAMLFGNPRVYGSSGYRVVTNALEMSGSLARRFNPFCGKPMVKALGDEEWPDGQINLRGPAF